MTSFLLCNRLLKKELHLSTWVAYSLLPDLERNYIRAFGCPYHGHMGHIDFRRLARRPGLILDLAWLVETMVRAVIEFWSHDFRASGLRLNAVSDGPPEGPLHIYPNYQDRPIENSSLQQCIMGVSMKVGFGCTGLTSGSHALEIVFP